MKQIKLILIIGGFISLTQVLAQAQKPEQKPEQTPAVVLFQVQGDSDTPIIIDDSEKETKTKDIKGKTEGGEDSLLLNEVDRRTVSLPFTVKVEKANPNTPLDTVIFSVDGIQAKIDKVYPYTLTIGDEWKLKEGEGHLLEVIPVALIKKGKENIVVSGKTISWTFLTPELPSPSPQPTPIEEEKK